MNYHLLIWERDYDLSVSARSTLSDIKRNDADEFATNKRWKTEALQSKFVCQVNEPFTTTKHFPCECDSLQRYSKSWFKPRECYR